MVAIPPRPSNTVDVIYDSYVEAQRNSPPRTHLGASEIGRACERQIWYSFHWVKKIEFDGRMLRLFDTGNLAEGRLVADLRRTGAEVHAVDPKTRKQFRMELFGGHFGGSLDGVVRGLVEAPKTWHLLEMKTHNDKSFKSLLKDGVQKSKPEHYAQMQTYMGMSHEQLVADTMPTMERALYMAVNKNDDMLYTERIEYDPVFYMHIKEKARRIILAQTPPPRISNNPASLVCKWCPYTEICHAKGDSKVFPKSSRTCRTCVHTSVVADEGKWACEKWNKILCQDEQVKGCENHLYAPAFIPLQQVDANDHVIVYQTTTGEEVYNHAGGEISDLPF